MKILAIDTSCDDTSVAVVERKNNKIEILSNIVASQIKIHSPYGGVYPMLAKREHQKNLVPVCEKALKKAGLLTPDTKLDGRPVLYQVEKILSKDQILLEKTTFFLKKYQNPNATIQAIAVTNTPGLEPCLWQGINFAKALSCYWGIPLVPVNHIKAHLSANWLTKPPSGFGGRGRSHSVASTPQFPAIGLVASGGHTELLYMPKKNKYQLIGSTRDDAAGECFDKTARILGLPYPGGPAIAALAKCSAPPLCPKQRGGADAKLPRPMIKSNDFDFSFSGLKTAVLYNFQSQNKATQQSQDYKIAMAKEIQQAIIDVLITKTIKAVEKFNAKSIIAGGGVMANKELSKQFKAQCVKLKIKFFAPSKNLCMDNAAMIGSEALMAKNPPIKNWNNLKANGNLKI